MAFCSNCGTQYQDGTRFCPRCGAASQPAAPPMYAPPPQQPPYGGYAPPPQAPYYAPQPMPYAQQRYGGAKSKSVAVLIALFFNAWTWAYTFKRDKGKFFMTIIVGAVLTIAFYATRSYAVLVGIYLFSGIIWLWAFFGALLRNSQWYAQY